MSVRLVYDMSDFEKRLNNFGIGMSDTVLNSFLSKGLVDLYILSQQDCPVRTGFLQSTGAAELLPGKTAGMVSYFAPYAIPVHEGYTKGNRFVKGRKFLYPNNSETAFHDMVVDMSKFYSDLAAGLTTPNNIPHVQLPRARAGSRGRRPGIHRFTSARITATGKKSFLFRGPKGRFTKVFFPGIGKGQRQAARKVRIGSSF
jgi:hypothetical protein